AVASPVAETEEVVEKPKMAIKIPQSEDSDSSSSLLLNKLESELFGSSKKAVEEVFPALDEIKGAWVEESKSINSPTFKNILRHAKLDLDDGKLRVSVGSRMAREMVINEVDFSRSLKKRVGYSNLIMKVEVDPEVVTAQKNTKPKKVLTIKETYDLMKETNPLVEDLRKRFDLKLDK
ncbi:MAG: hypothetical protein HKN16_09010, partial [Saprospiraceae bacterium]|nr:hypothetical protein [Saprospiraceae bacterium]